jgi:hypothetical protein
MTHRFFLTIGANHRLVLLVSLAPDAPSRRLGRTMVAHSPPFILAQQFVGMSLTA